MTVTMHGIPARRDVPGSAADAFAPEEDGRGGRALEPLAVATDRRLRFDVEVGRGGGRVEEGSRGVEVEARLVETTEGGRFVDATEDGRRGAREEEEGGRRREGAAPEAVERVDRIDPDEVCFRSREAAVDGPATELADAGLVTAERVAAGVVARRGAALTPGLVTVRAVVELAIERRLATDGDGEVLRRGREVEVVEGGRDGRTDKALGTGGVELLLVDGEGRTAERRGAPGRAVVVEFDGRFDVGGG